MNDYTGYAGKPRGEDMSTKIEWVKNEDGSQGYTINPVKGLCPVGCSFCYARRMYKRFKWDETITYHDEVFQSLPVMPARIFVGSTIDLFHDNIIGVFPRILEQVNKFPQHTFIFLTKCPQNLPKVWPDNCWVGVSVPRIWDDTFVGHFEAYQRISQLGEVWAKVKFVSFEPLLANVAPEFMDLATSLKAHGINWVIIGAQTPYSKKTAPLISWVQEIVNAADKAKIPVFLKENLLPLFRAEMALDLHWAFVYESEYADIRQELPRT